MNKANNYAAPTPPSTLPRRKVLVPCELSVDEQALIHTAEELNKLHAGCEPVIYSRVAEYLAMTEGHDAMLIAAWRKCGRADRTRSVNISLGEAARSTLSPLGTACLIAYAQAWLDECQARVHAARKAST